MKINPELIAEVRQFLACETPSSWLKQALQQQDILLIDHAQCEKKAASSALSLMYRYQERAELLIKMSRLAREELRHFEQVLKLLQARNITYRYLPPSNYANGLRAHLRTEETARLVDLLIIGAFIEARSCERFAALAPYLDPELSSFYTRLLTSEARHFIDYLTLAKTYSDESIENRIAEFAEIEKTLILGQDEVFRFHSGVMPDSVIASGAKQSRKFF